MAHPASAAALASIGIMILRNMARLLHTPARRFLKLSKRDFFMRAASGRSITAKHVR
jgi:hypothetical protein